MVGIAQGRLTLLLAVSLTASACTDAIYRSMNDPARDEWQQPDAVVQALKIRPGDVIWDLGAGGGYFTFPLAQATGPTGRVYAIDTDEDSLRFIRQEGAKRGGLGKDAGRCVIYISDNAHFSIDRAVDFMGFGEESLCRIPMTPDHQMDPRSLEKAIDSHLAKGFIPLCIVATIGSASCSDYDDVGALSWIAKDRGIWLHVDAAATGPYASLTELAPVFTGLVSADSVTVDPYKAMYLPFGLGCLLVKEPKLLLASFDTDPDYFHDDQRLNSFKMSFRGTAPWAAWAAVAARPGGRRRSCAGSARASRAAS